MKKFINYALRDYACTVIFFSIGFSMFNDGVVVPVSVLLNTFIAILLLALLELLVEKFIPFADYPLLGPIVTYIVCMPIIIAYWRLVGWYEFITIWFLIISVTLIDATSFILDYHKDKKDIAFINEQLRQRRDKKNNTAGKQDNEKGGGNMR